VVIKVSISSNIHSISAKFQKAITAAKMSGFDEFSEKLPSDELRAAFAELSAGKVFPIDFATGDFKKDVQSIAKILKVQPEELFGFNKAIYEDAVDHLRNGPRTAFKLRTKGMNAKDIADVMGVKVDSAERDYALALTKISHYCELHSTNHKRHQETRFEGFLASGDIHGDDRFLASWQQLVNKKNQMKPEAFAHAIDHFSVMRHPSKERVRKSMVRSIVDQQILGEDDRIRADMQPEHLKRILLAYAYLDLTPTSRLQGALENIFHARPEFRDPLREIAFCDALMPKDRNAVEAPSPADVIEPPVLH
jgi:hypothetical protein